MTTERWCSFSFIITNIDSIMKNIQLLFCILQSQWPSTSEHSTSSKSANHLCIFCVLLDIKVTAYFQQGGSCSCFIFGQLTSQDASPCACLPYYFISSSLLSPFPSLCIFFCCLSHSLSFSLSLFSCLDCPPLLI